MEDGTRAELNKDIEEGRLKTRLKRQMGWGWLLNGLVYMARSLGFIPELCKEKQWKTLIRFVLKKDHISELHHVPLDTDTLEGWLGCESSSFEGLNSDGSFSFMQFSLS